MWPHIKVSLGYCTGQWGRSSSFCFLSVFCHCVTRSSNWLWLTRSWSGAQSLPVDHPQRSAVLRLCRLTGGLGWGDSNSCPACWIFCRAASCRRAPCLRPLGLCSSTPAEVDVFLVAVMRQNGWRRALITALPRHSSDISRTKHPQGHVARAETCKVSWTPPHPHPHLQLRPRGARSHDPATPCCPWNASLFPNLFKISPLWCHKEPHLKKYCRI